VTTLLPAHRCLPDDELLELALGRLARDAARELLSGIERCADCSVVFAEVGRLVAEEAGDPIHVAASRPGIRPGDVLGGRFSIVRPLGAGGMGEVFEAIDQELGERLALKTIHSSLAQHDSRVDRFKQEVRLARQVRHPNVCRVLEFGRHEGALGPCYFLTMELLSGEPLSERLRRAGRLPVDDVLRIADDLVAGLSAIHAAGILHRDIKTNNVMVCSRERVVLLDFGIARPLASTDSPLTGGGVIGTPEYMAPEQLRGGELSPATDVYALGLVLFELLTGQLPFIPDGSLSHVIKRLDAKAPRPRTQVPELPAALDELVAHCLEPRSEDRPADASSLRAALEYVREGTFERTTPRALLGAVTGPLTPAEPAHPPARSRRVLVWPLAALALIAVLWSLWRLRPPDAQPREPVAASPIVAPTAPLVPAATLPVPIVEETPKPRERTAARKRPHPDAVKPPAPLKADCSPPYDYDERGLRVYRKDCL
jgi:hypothetical protein